MIGHRTPGIRHPCVLQTLNLDVATIFQRFDVGWENCHDKNEEILDARPDFVILANATHLHQATFLKILIG